MRRAGPILILVIGLLALVINFWPRLQIPDASSSDGTWRTVETRLGLDLQGGLRAEYQALPVGDKRPGPADMAIIKDIVERRVNSTGVSEPVVTTQGSDRVVVELPGVTDPEAMRKLINQTGLLQFVPLGSTQATDGQVLDPKQYPPLFRGDQVASATVGQDQNGRPAVDFVLKDEGKNKFAQYTAANIGSYFAITLDNAVVSAPVIQNSIPNGNVQITGGGLAGFSAKDATQLVTVLKFGSLPFPITALSSETISATLGSQFLDQTVLAGLLGISLVVAFMLIYYRLPGAVAAFALIYYTLVMYAIFRLIPVTLTLAGIAGFVLSIGMAVDANILIFERMKEELRLGKSLPAAVEAGFNRAWNSILDSNV
jgi:protein-export membrane protein SecD